jgi:hypothetical protein
MINSNTQDDRESIAAEASEFNIGSLPVLKDDIQGVARHLGVKRTGETFALSTKDWTILYRGAIDDQLVEGAQKPKPAEKYVENAIEQFLNGSAVSIPQTTAKGCLIHCEIDPLKETEPVSYAKEIAPLLESKCVNCHSTGNIGSWAMSNYKKVKGMSDMIQEVVLAKRMPPWHPDPKFGHWKNDLSLAETEKEQIYKWVAAGAPGCRGRRVLLRLHVESLSNSLTIC